MIKKLSYGIITMTLGVILALPVLVAFTAPAQAVSQAELVACEGAGGTPKAFDNKKKEYVTTTDYRVMTKCDTPGSSLEVYIKNIATALIFAAGAIAVVIMIIGGLGYVTSTGDPARIMKAKNTILYAVMGLIVALLAYAIVGFVVTRI